jgi:hypothetical protein
MIKNYQYTLANSNLNITQSNLDGNTISTPNSNSNRNNLNINPIQEIDLGLIQENPTSKQKCKILSIPKAECVFVSNLSNVKRINYNGSFSEEENFNFNGQEGLYRGFGLNIGDLKLIKDGVEDYRFAFSILNCNQNYFYATEASPMICPSGEFNIYRQNQKIFSNTVIIVTGKERDYNSTENFSGVNTVQIDFGILPDKIAYDYTRGKMFVTNLYSPLSLSYDFKSQIKPSFIAGASYPSQFPYLCNSGMIACVNMEHKDRGNLVKEIYPTTYIDNVGPLPIGINYDEDKDLIFSCNYIGKSIDVVNPETNEVIHQIKNIGSNNCGPTDILGFGQNVFVSVSNTTENQNVSKLLILRNQSSEYILDKTIELSPGVIEIKRYNNKIYATCYSGVNIIDLDNLNNPVKEIMLSGYYHYNPENEQDEYIPYMARSACVLKDKLFISVTSIESTEKWLPPGNPDYYNGYGLPAENQRQKVLLFPLEVEAEFSSSSSSKSSRSRISSSLSSFSSSDIYIPIGRGSSSSFSLSSILVSSSSISSATTTTTTTTTPGPSSSSSSDKFNIISTQRKASNYIKNIFKRAAFIAGGIYEENNFSALYRTIADIKNYIGCKVEEIIKVCQSLSMRILDGGNIISGNVQTPVLLNSSKITIVADNLGSTNLPVSAYELSINGKITTIYSSTYEFEGTPGVTYSVKIRAICGENNCESISMIVKDGTKSITGDITTPVNIDNDYITVKAESKNATDTEADYYELEINGVSRIVNIRTYQFTGNKDIVYSLRMRSVCVTKEPCPDFDTFEGYTVEAIYVHSPNLDNKFEICKLPSSSSVSSSSSSV